jgi:hypothetical protein
MNQQPELSDFVLGLDLGKTTDYSALAALEREYRPRPDRPNEMLSHYVVRFVKRWPLGTPYTAVVPQVVKAAGTPKFATPLLAVDETGVGKAVVDLLRQANPPASLQPILITGGSATTFVNGSWHVPKVELVNTLKVLMQAFRFQIADMPERKLLERELDAFRTKVTAAGNETFEAWRQRDHDDLVLAIALAAWLGEKFGRPSTPFVVPRQPRDPFGRKVDPWEEGNEWREMTMADHDTPLRSARARGMYGLR